MKHLLNNLTEQEKAEILAQHTGGKKIMIENFNKLIKHKSGDVKTLVNEQVPQPKPGAPKPPPPAVADSTNVKKPTIPPAAKPATPAAQPATPAAQPATPAAQPATPAAQPATPAAQPSSFKSPTPTTKPTTPQTPAPTTSQMEEQEDEDDFDFDLGDYFDDEDEEGYEEEF